MYKNYFLSYLYYVHYDHTLGKITRGRGVCRGWVIFLTTLVNVVDDKDNNQICRCFFL